MLLIVILYYRCIYARKYNNSVESQLHIFDENYLIVK